MPAPIIIPGGRRVSLQLDSLPLPPRQALARAGELGFDAVGADASSGAFAPDRMSRSGAREVRHLLERAGMTLSHLSAGAGRALADLHWTDQVTETVLGVLDLAYRLGARWVTLPLGVPAASDTPAWDQTAEALRLLALQAGNWGIRLAVETGPAPVADLVKLLDAAASDCLTVAFTPGALLLRGVDVLEAARILAGRSDIVVVRDVFAASDGVLKDASFGSGSVPWKELVQVFSDHGFGGCYVVRRAPSADSEAEVKKALQFIRNTGMLL